MTDIIFSGEKIKCYHEICQKIMQILATKLPTTEKKSIFLNESYLTSILIAKYFPSLSYKYFNIYHRNGYIINQNYGLLQKHFLYLHKQ